MAIAAAIVVLAAHAAAIPGVAMGKSSAVRALIVKRAHSPVLDAFRNRLGDPGLNVDRTAPPGGKRRNHDLLIVDGDELSPRQLAKRRELSGFSAANRWVLALDVGKRHHRRALEKHTGFSAAGANGGHNSDAFLFRRTLVNGSPTVIMLDARPFGALPKELTKKERRRARKRHARIAAKEIASYVTADKGKLGAIAAAGDAPPELQRVKWSYTEQGSEATPFGYYLGDRGTDDDVRWIPPPFGKYQISSWTMTHEFNVYLDNGDGHPQGNNQIVTYDLHGQFSPKQPGGPFFHMFDRSLITFDSGLRTITGLIPERAWWTGIVGNSVTPDPQTDAKMLWQASEPQTPNAETTYTSGQEFSVGFTGSAGPEGPGVGFDASYSVSNEQSHTIPDWGVENQGAGNDLAWRFSARHACDPRPEHYTDEQCFSDQEGQITAGSLVASFTGEALPTQPNDLSLGQMPVETSARWKTKGLLDGADGKMSFSVATPVEIEDTVCAWDSRFTAANWCVAPGLRFGGLEINRNGTGPDPQVYSFDAASVIPIPIQSLTFSPKQANGTKADTVTGTVTLEKNTGMDTSIVIYSDSKNASVGAPSAGFSSKLIPIPKGHDSADFTITTNDNTLNPGQHTTANITAFYADSFTKPLRICAGRPPC